MKKILIIFCVFLSLDVFSQDVRQGKSSYGTVLYNYDGQYLRQGKSSYGTVLFNVDGMIPKGIILLLCL